MVTQESGKWGLKVVIKLPVDLRGSSFRQELSSGFLPSRIWDVLLLLPLAGALTPATVLLLLSLPFDSLHIIFLSYFCFRSFLSYFGSWYILLSPHSFGLHLTQHTQFPVRALKNISVSGTILRDIDGPSDIPVSIHLYLNTDTFWTRDKRQSEVFLILTIVFLDKENFISPILDNHAKSAGPF